MRVRDAIVRRISRLPVIYLREPEIIIKKNPHVKNIKKILIVAHSPSSSLLEISINNAFNELGYYSEIFPISKNLALFEKGSYSLWRTIRYYPQPDLGHWLFNRRLFKKIRNEKFNQVFILESNWVVLPETIIDIKNKTNALIVLWESNIHIWNRHQSDCLPLYDAVFCLDGYLMPIWETANVKKAFHLSVCVDEKLNSVPEICDEEREFYKCNIGFVGRLYKNRVQLFENLVDFNFKIFGPQLANVLISENLKKKIVSDSISIEGKRKFYNITKINVDIQGNYLHINSPNIRLFEIVLCGGFPLVEYRKDLDEMFKIGKELICFYNTKDLIDKVNHYLSKPAERREITARCRDRILREHTVKIRMKQMIDMLAAK